MQPPAIAAEVTCCTAARAGADRVRGDLVDVGEPHAAVAERADVELPAPVAVARAEHGEPVRGECPRRRGAARGGGGRSARAAARSRCWRPRRPPTRPEAWCPRGRRRTRGRRPKAGDRAEEGGAVAAVQRPASVRRTTRPGPGSRTASVMATSAASLIRLVAAPRLRPAAGIVEVAAVVDVVPGERLGDACLAQHRGCPGLVSRPSVAVERHADQLDPRHGSIMPGERAGGSPGGPRRRTRRRRRWRGPRTGRACRGRGRQWR